MKKMLLFTLACLLLSGVAFAQQDPDDPGFQDSLIIEGVTVDSGAIFANIRIWAVTDDSVNFYNLPLKWTAPLGGVFAGQGTQYFPPLTSWDVRFDTVMMSQTYVRNLGWAEIFADTIPNPPIQTNHQRTHLFTLRFIINPGAHRQMVILDTTRDDRNGSVVLGLSDGIREVTPGVKAGYLGIGVGVEDDINVPVTYVLKQNYPNPFNPETNIEFSLPKEQDVSLTVFNLLGQQVRTLVNSRLASGDHTITWDGKNDNGVGVPSGIYFYRLYTPEFAQTNKMVMLR